MSFYILLHYYISYQNFSLIGIIFGCQLSSSTCLSHLVGILIFRYLHTFIIVWPYAAQHGWTI